MTRREIKEIKAAIGKIERTRVKILKLAAEASLLQDGCQKELDALAKKTCPYKRGQVFRKRGSNVWARMTGVTATQLKYGRISEQYMTAPYQLDCLRCSVKGVTQPGKFMLINGYEVGGVWDLVEP